jgi:hypothetical protein
MTELSYAKTFLNLLDTKPSKISATHVEDPKTYPARSAVSSPPPFPPPPKLIKEL